ncbi:integrase [Vibrio cholerae]|nr:integrase [Vibrio cholerae]
MTKDISRYNMRWVEGDTLPEAPKPKLSPKERYLKCSGQLKLATVLEFSQYNRSDSLGVKPPLY